MRASLIALALAGGLALGGAAGSAHAYYGHSQVDIDVISPQGRAMPLYPARGSADRGPLPGSPDQALRAWLEAVPGAPYAIRVRNRSAERVGVVIAVDGRNIISGTRSSLSSNERMYVLGPFQSAVYEGWRTSRNVVNEFYFTSERRSYAAAFGDYSAIGVISAAVYRDADGRRPWREPKPDLYGKQGGPQSGAKQKNGPGTGFGDEVHSPSRRVHFRALRRPSSVILIRYEWRDRLCELGVVRCAAPDRYNRLWDRSYQVAPGFAPYPPGHTRGRYWRR